MSYSSHINGDRRSSTDDGTQPGSSNDQTTSQSSGPYQAGGTNPQQHNGYPAQVNGAAGSSRDMTQPEPSELASDNAADLSVRPWSEDHISWLRRGEHDWTRAQTLTQLWRWCSDFATVLHYVYPRETIPQAKASMWQNLKNNLDATDMKVQRLILITNDEDYRGDLESIRGEIDSLHRRLMERRFSLNASV
ncbi:hypothetical protein CMUS01_00665 [Colletotrichum musicola]|uniref:Uncharacterized protein n=1 Tax=Colletotrichum musicola TaxID=2175873 RepID=A0A8H6NYH9_9PEZI|nr:hypothetical protein CMUS01_00665 [Colletotrichum musicola]